MTNTKTVENQKRLVVVGGVAAGMSAAARARRLDEHAEIIVLEKGPYVSFANCGLPYFVGGEITDEAALLVQTPQSLHASLNLDVRVRHQVSALDADAQELTVEELDAAGKVVKTDRLSYDHLVLSPGAVAFEPPIAGTDLPHVHMLRTVDEAKTILDAVQHPRGNTKTAAVLGAGFIGLEAAEALAHQGWKVNLVELSDHVLPPLDIEMANVVQDELRRIGINVLTGVGAAAIAQNTVTLTDGQEIDADLVIMSVGVRPDTKVFQDAGLACARDAIIIDKHGRTNLKNVWAGGDATVSCAYPTSEATCVPMPHEMRPVPLAGPANRAGRLIADDIYDTGDAREIPSALGTAIVRAGKLTAAMTGANRRTLEEAGAKFHTIHLHPNQHAGYFPGAKMIHLVVHFSDTGVILGAQAVGEDGVDKRIDVLATAMRGGLKMEDLIDLDLSYSPPYGSAKDPVNMAGMMGQNVLQGELVQWQASDLETAKKTGFILDVRTPAEFASGHLAEAVNIPHTQVRDNLDKIRELAAGRKVYVICRSGMRSYLAYRILVQNGFDAANFSGGSLTLEATLGRAL